MKKKAGQNSVNNIKTSKFLPKVFQTELNKNWLDSTLDQMVSKGPLEDLNGYIGSRTGKDALSTDTYLEPKFHKALRTKNQLQPGVISYDNSDNVTNMITFDDVAHSINENFATYNYNAAYASSLYSFNPPIDIDKFINYKNYHWVEELPVYESIWTGAAKNPTTDIATGLSTITDDNNTFTVEEGMLIKFTGSGHAAILNKTYLVSGSTGKHRLHEYFNATGTRVYNNTVKHTQSTDGVYTNPKIFNVSPGTATTYTGTPEARITAFNANTSRLPIFDGFLFDTSIDNPTQLANNVFVKFTGSWTHGATNNTDIFSVTVDPTSGDVAIASATTKELAGLTVSPTNNVMYNSGLPVTPLKDYIVVAKHDALQSAWSRANHWVNISTINKLKTLLPNYNFSEILKQTRQALRPIIEYNAGLNMWECSKHEHNEADTQAENKLAVDHGVTAAESATIAAFAAGTTYVYIDGTDLKYYTVGATPASVTLTNNNTFSIKNSTNSLWNDADVFVEAGVIKLAQQKTKINQYPLYRLYNQEGIGLENINGIGFKGANIFGYKKGTGTVLDSELGKVLCFKDTPKGGEYEFENFIITKKYLNSFQHVENDNLSHTKAQTGYTLFKQSDVLKSIYTPAGKSAGASEHIQYEITIDDAPLVIPYGQSNWRPTQSYYVHSDAVRYQSSGDQLAITIVNSDGVQSTARVGTASLYMVGVGQEFVLHNLTSDTITFSTQSEITTTTVGTTTTITTSASSNNKQFDVLVNGVLLQTFFITNKWDNLFHKTIVNGKEVLNSQETQNAAFTTTTIDNSIFKKGDIVDFYWNNNNLTNKTTNTSLPDVLTHNVHNTPISTFTISETLSHWESKLNAMPNFSGNTFGENNFASIPHTPYYGGTIFMSEDISIMNDINYSDSKLSITGALNEQANDYVGFRNRVIAQARRVYSTTGATSIQNLTDKAIQQVIKNKHDDGLYKASNMLFTQTDDMQSFITKNATTTKFKTRYIFNGDLNIRDHVYVYLTESSSRKLLLKDTDYTINGDTVLLSTAPGTNAVVEIYYSQMDEPCFIPPSMVKLGLAYGVEPQVHLNTLYTHDGMQIDVTGKDIENINAGATFDPVNAVVFEMEKRIFAGIVKFDIMYGWLAAERIASPIEFIPSKHTSSWFAINDLNNYLEKYYYQWAKHNSITSLNTTGYYSASDETTWNYSTINTYEDFGTTLPGHYKGAYTHLFGTCTPHITPWHMLGYGFKPSWWDTYYSWTDASKRVALHKALINGIVENPAYSNIVQDVKYARHNWDWSTRCPVKTDGTLESISVVLDPNSNVTNVAKEADFVFGDWGPVEINWRSAANGQAMTVDAISKLLPAKAWTAFFQPGFISRTYSKIANVGRYNELLPASVDYKMPGEVYGSSISNITLTGTNPPTAAERTGWFKILDDYDSTIAKATYNFKEGTGPNTGTIDSISLIERGLHFTNTPVLSYVGTTGAANDICVDIELKKIPFVANGIAQAQYNYIRRNHNNISQSELYSNLTTKLQEKLSGFTSKHLLDISADSSISGDFILGEGDFNIEMYNGAVTDSVTASAVIIKKTLTGWTVSGLSNNNREFKFFEPNLVRATNYTTQTIANQQVRRYNDFVATASIAEYDVVFERVQDTYNFIRGYWEWMRTSGYTIVYDGDSSAADFVTWSVTAEVDNLYILQLGREIKFKPTHGHVYEYNQLEYNNNDVLDTNSNRLQTSDLSISRTDGTVNIETKNKEFIGSITSAVLDYEHVVIFENKTKLGIHLFDDIKNRRQERLLVRGQRTSNWTGEKKAPGYLVVDNHIVQNFDSAVQSVDDIYRTDVNEFNEAFTKAKDLTIGNVDGQLLDGIGIDKNVLTNYYQGVIKEKGTKNALQHIGKSNLLSGDNSSVSAFEQYMFRQSTLGNSDMEDPLEIEIVSSDINSSPQTVSLNAAPTSIADIKANVIYKTNAKTVNDKVITFDTLSYNDSVAGILTGGETLKTETKYQIENAAGISAAFDKTAAFAKIPTWNNYTSYKKGEQVRHNGQLWNCIVDFTGLTVATDNIVVTGSETNASFPNGTLVNIAGIPQFAFNDTNTIYNDITATGSVSNPTFLPSLGPLTITHGGVPVNINFVNNGLVTTVTAGAELTGNTTPYTTPVAIADVTGKSITLNSIVVDFDTTPANVIENFTGVTSQTDFTIAQALSASTYSTGLVTVTVDGTAETGFNITGQTLTFTTAPAAAAVIVVTLVHVTNSMNATEVVDKINTYTGTSFVTASINTNGLYPLTLQLSRAMGLITDSIVLSASATNTELGLPSGGTTTHPASTTVTSEIALSVTQVAQSINNASSLTSKVSAAVVANKLVLTSINNNSNGLTISGDPRTVLGLNATYAVTSTSTNRDTKTAEAVIQIQTKLTAANSTVTIVELGNAIVITSPEASLELGATNFNTLAGLSTGTVTAIGSTIKNTFITSPASFAATDDDDALYNILVTNDSDFEIASSGSIVTKFYGWNVLQVQHFGAAQVPLFTKSTDGSTCGICAGVSSKDGNDAEITTDVSHMLQVGDFVQLLNTTTTPNIDGIHKITKLGIGSYADRIFYIDEFIEKCGNAVSVKPLVTTRFKDVPARNNTIANTRWNLPTNKLVFASSLTVGGLLGTYVYKTATGNTWTDIVRQTTHRPTNTDIDSIVIYNHKDNKSKVQLEAWDPMRKIIPGIAQQNLDYINVSDNAIYTTSSDTNQLIDTDSAWGEEQLGTRWWDTSKVRYYDYDQGSTAYKSVVWGMLYPGSEVVVWEWVKASVPPDDYNDAVKNSTEILGTIATGAAFSVYDSVADEHLYYYTIAKEWNKQTNSYNDVYYYWVKNKTTISDTRELSAFDVANIIEDPTTSGISWFAVVGDKEFIIDNIQYYVDDKNTVIQINKAGDKYKSHNEWTLITKDSDLIPEYYINGMRQNLAGRDTAKNLLPFQSLHRFNRFGDDIDIGQTWFNDLTDARRNAAVTINMLLQHINLDQEYKDTWDRTFIANGFPKRLWTWHDYRLASYTGTTNHTTTVTSYADLANIDRDFHVVAKIAVFDTAVQRNRSEIYAYNDVTNKWDLVLKKNITIQFNVDLLTLEGGWDMAAFDSTPFDQADIAEYWETIITALQKDIFVHYNVHYMNTLFFSIVNHTLSSFAQTNWVRKTTYIKLELNNIIDSTTKKYKKNNISNVLGYIQEVKPFHTKVSTVVTKYAPKEESTVELTPTESLRINVQTNVVGSTEAATSRTFVHIQDKAGVVVAHALQETKRTTITAPLGVADTTISGTFGAFSATGFAYIGGELIEFAKTSATLLSITTREVSGTFAISAAIGKSITEVAGLTFSNPATTLQYQALSEELLQTSPSSVLAQELQALGQGITL